jgi:hypothetical protein
MRKLLQFIRSLRGSGNSDYSTGYNDALDAIEEWVRDEMWKEGEDEDESG